MIRMQLIRWLLYGMQAALLYAGDDGLMNVTSGARISAIQCLLAEGVAEGEGGAVLAAMGSSMRLEGCHIRDCHAGVAALLAHLEQSHPPTP